MPAFKSDGKGLHTLSINQSLHGVRKPEDPLTTMQLVVSKNRMPVPPGVPFTIVTPS